MREFWAKIEGYNSAYEVSTKGRVRSYLNLGGYPVLLKKPHHLKLQTTPRGYKFVLLRINGKYKMNLVHRLVAIAFIPNPYNYPQINHKDENPSNNRVENLEWCTAKYNLQYSHVCEKMKAAAVKKQQKAVLMYDKEGNFIREYESATIAAQAIGNYQQNVSACCYGKQKTVSGYKFKFK